MIAVTGAAKLVEETRCRSKRSILASFDALVKVDLPLNKTKARGFSRCEDVPHFV